MTTWVGGNYLFPWSGETPTTAHIIAMCTAVYDGLVGCGLVQTADTGQLNPASPPAWPGFNSDLGYWIFRFNDSLQGTYPIFLRITVGRGGGSTGAMRFTVNVGTGSNGSGTITGPITSGAVECHLSDGFNTSGVSNHQAYMCHTEGYALFFPKFNNTQTAFPGTNCWCAIERTRGSDGNFDGMGVVMLHAASMSNAAQVGGRQRSVRFATPAANYGGGHNSYCIVPTTLPLLTGDKQLFPHFYNFPEVRQCWSMFTFLLSDLSGALTTFSATPYGVTPRTFISFGNTGRSATGILGNATDAMNWNVAFLWE